MKFEKVIKRNGELEVFDANKVNRVVEWACEGLDVSPSAVLMGAANQVDKLPSTEQIHEALIKSANNLVDFANPDYSKVAARLKIFSMRKQTFGEFEPTPFYEHILEKTAIGAYDKHILEDFSRMEIEFLDNYLIHSRDLDYAYPAAVQWSEKYLVQDRVTKQLHESPQQAIMLIAMCLHANEDKEERIDHILDFYDEASNNRISLPTPIMCGVRTPTRQFSSCCLIETGDSLESINATSNAVVNYISKRAGIGINGGAIRAVGSPIRGGEAIHTGLIPFYKLFHAAVKSCSQGAVRGGAGNIFYPIWHLEVESLLVLKNNKGTEDNRIRGLDYTVQLSGLFYKRLVSKGNITLFSPDVANGELFKLFFENEEKFTQLYEKLEADHSIRKKTISAVDLFTAMMTERAQTGRIYIQNVDNTTKQGTFIPELAPVKQSNLCVAPETQVLTDKGFFPIADLEGQDIKVWNGEQFSKTKVFKTGINRPLIKIVTDSGQELECTPEHHFYIQKGGELVKLPAINLTVGDTLIDFELPLASGIIHQDNEYIKHLNKLVLKDMQLYLMTKGIHSYVSEDADEEMFRLTIGKKPIKIEAIIDEGRTDDTYCFTEPKRNMGMFNGLLTGQCVEVVLPTAPMGSPDEEIALCTLAAVNLGAVTTVPQMRKSTKVIVRALDNLLDYQDYAHPAALKNKLRRTLGVGVVNYAYSLAKQGMRYGNARALQYTHDIFESLQYHLLLASNELAMERGACELFSHTKYSQGLLPIDLYNKNVDSIISPSYKLDWESLRDSVSEYGLRNSTLSAIMPSEGSSLISNATNGIEPPRGTVVTKSSKSGTYKHVLPDITTLMYAYDYLWDMISNKGYLDTCAIIQKFVDQSISANTNYDPGKFIGSKVPLSTLLKDLIYAYKMGLKTLYYHNTRDGSGMEEQDDGCSSGACKI